MFDSRSGKILSFGNIVISQHYQEKIGFPCRECFHCDAVIEQDGNTYIPLFAEDQCLGCDDTISNIPTIFIYLEMIRQMAYPGKFFTFDQEDDEKRRGYDKIYNKYCKSHVCRQARIDILDFINYLSKMTQNDVEKQYIIMEQSDKPLLTKSPNVIAVVLKLIDPKAKQFITTKYDRICERKVIKYNFLDHKLLIGNGNDIQSILNTSFRLLSFAIKHDKSYKIKEVIMID